MPQPSDTRNTTGERKSQTPATSRDTPARPKTGLYVVPGDKAERQRLADLVRNHVARSALVPPLVMEEIEEQADLLLKRETIDPRFREFLFILINNEVWRPVVAAIPFERRTLMLPPCLRKNGACKAAFDELGLLCERCGACRIAGLSEQAEDLGYQVLVAEGTTIVGSLVAQGKVDAVIGVSCMAALERTFPHMVAGAVPVQAIPLLVDGCEETEVDADWVRDALTLHAPDPSARPLNLSGVHEQVRAWFNETSLRKTLNCGDSPTEKIAFDWLVKSGKRWRPFLTVSVYLSLRKCPFDQLPEFVKRVAIAVECIHKASLIYDDIQDNDANRYASPTVHTEQGVPMALTSSLLLLGYGYRLLSQCGETDRQRADLLFLSTDGHCRLCLGQGSELWWTRNPSPLTVPQVLEIFRLKTAPSFEVVFEAGGICAGADDTVRRVLQEYSEAIGVAYQIRDDLEDFTSEGDVDDILSRRPSILLALAFEHATDPEKEVIGAVWGRGMDADKAAAIRAIIAAHQIEDRAREILARYKTRAFHVLKSLADPDLKRVLCQVVGKVFGA
jgi:geranylgeranyl pyrophosphate synthase